MAPQLTHVDDRRRRRQPTRRRARWASLGLGVVLLAGCARVPSNTPEAYTDTAEDGTVIVENNYLSACAESGENESDCRCFYDGIVDTVPFDQFKDFESQLDEDPTDVPSAYDDIVTDCQRGETVGPTADPGSEDATTTSASPS